MLPLHFMDICWKWDWQNLWLIWIENFSRVVFPRKPFMSGWIIPRTFLLNRNLKPVPSGFVNDTSLYAICLMGMLAESYSSNFLENEIIHLLGTVELNFRVFPSRVICLARKRRRAMTLKAVYSKCTPCDKPLPYNSLMFLLRQFWRSVWYPVPPFVVEVLWIQLNQK